MSKIPFKSFRVPLKAYVPKWVKRKIKIGDLLTGRRYSDMHTNVWPMRKNNQIIIGIALSEMNKKRIIEIEDCSFPIPEFTRSKYLLPY